MNIPTLSLRTSFDTDADGTPETIVLETYSADGNILTSAIDSNADGQDDTVTTYTYNNDGIQTGLSVDNIESDNTRNTFSFTSDYTVNDNGVAIYTEIRIDRINDTEDIKIYKFDSAGNFVEEATGKISEDGTVEETQVTTTYAYNSSGQVTVYEVGGSRTEYAYNSAGQITAVETDGSRTEYTYDSLGRLTGITTPSSSSVYEYDETGNIIRIEQNRSDSSNSISTYTYDKSNRLIESDTSGNAAQGPLGTSFSRNLRYEYNEAGQVTSYRESNGTAGRFFGNTYAYTYNEAGNLIKSVSSGTGRSFGLTGETTYKYNAAGQVTSYIQEQSSFESKIVEINYVYEYDNAGNLIEESFDRFVRGGPSTPSDSITKYSYDDVGRITSLSIDVDADGTVNNITSYGYDDLLAGGVGSATVSEFKSAMEADIFSDETVQSVALGASDVFSSNELVSSFALESSTLLDTEASLIPTDQFSV